MVAVGADEVLKRAKVEWKLEDALADATLVLAATARPRGMEKPVWGPREAAANLRAAIARGERPVVMFGPEAAGMETDEVARADAILTLAGQPGFRLAQPRERRGRVRLRLRRSATGGGHAGLVSRSDSPPATQEEFGGAVHASRARA